MWASWFHILPWKCMWNTHGTLQGQHILQGTWPRKSYRGNREGLRDLCVRGNLWRDRNKKYHVDREITSASWKSKTETQEEMSIVPQVTSLKDTAVHTAVCSCHPWPRRQNHLWGQTRQKVSAHPGWAGGCIRSTYLGWGRSLVRKTHLPAPTGHELSQYSSLSFIKHNRKHFFFFTISVIILTISDDDYLNFIDEKTEEQRG